MTSVAYYRAKVAGLSRDRAPDDPELIEARINLRFELTAARLRRALSETPFTVEQRSRLAAACFEAPAGAA